MTKKEFESQDNIVRLEGPVFSCITKDTGNDNVVAWIRLVTGPRENRQYHRIKTMASGENARKLRDLEKKCQMNIEQWNDGSRRISEQRISVYGHLAATKEGTMVLVSEKDLQYTNSRKNTVNSANIRGELVDLIHNEAYATALVKVNDREALPGPVIPVTFYRKDNPKKWSELAEGDVKKGEHLSFGGALMSKTYSNGDKSIFRCSINTDNYIRLDKKQKQSIHKGQNTM